MPTWTKPACAVLAWCTLIIAAAACGMPRWLTAILAATGAAIGAVLVAGPATVIDARRCRSAGRRRAAGKASVVLAEHDRLIVLYSRRDDTVYALIPPGEDPQAVLRAARLVVPEESYGELADQLGVPARCPPE